LNVIKSGPRFRTGHTTSSCAKTRPTSDHLGIGGSTQTEEGEGCRNSDLALCGRNYSVRRNSVGVLRHSETCCTARHRNALTPTFPTARKPSANRAELSAQTFCTFPREFSSIRRQRARTVDADPEPGPADLCVPLRFRFSELPGTDCTSRERSGRSGGQHSMVTRPHWRKGRSGMTPIGSLQRASDARRLRVTAGQRGPHRLCRSTFHPASVRQRPNAEARDCVRRHRTRPVDGRW
jgi:hypothetical protein